jgi:hypothetical protein
MSDPRCFSKYLSKILRNESVEDTSTLGVGRAVVDAVNVGHQDGKVGAGLNRDSSSQTVLTKKCILRLRLLFNELE